MPYCKKCNRPIQIEGLCERCEINKQNDKKKRIKKGLNIAKNVGIAILFVLPYIVSRGKIKPKF